MWRAGPSRGEVALFHVFDRKIRVTFISGILLEFINERRLSGSARSGEKSPLKDSPNSIKITHP